MSRIFRAFEKAWEARHDGARVEVLEETPLADAAQGTGAPRNGSSHAAPPKSRLASGLAALAGSVRIKLTHAAPVLPFDGSDPHAAEQYKIIRTKILHHYAQPRCVVVSSAQTEDGKSVTAANIAGCMALKDQTTVLLVDADLRRSSLAEVLGVPDSPGLADVLAGRSTLENAIARLEPFPNLYFLPRGEQRGSPAELLDSGRWRAIAALLRREFGFVVIDAPPVGLVADYDLLQEVSDGVILVIRLDHTNRSLGIKAIQSIPSEQLIGVIINCASEWFLTKSLGDRYYRYYYDQAP